MLPQSECTVLVQDILGNSPVVVVHEPVHVVAMVIIT